MSASPLPPLTRAQMIEQAREATGTLRDAVRAGRVIDFRERDPLIVAIHRALDLAALTAEGETRPDRFEGFVEEAVRHVAELPDRTSPANWPEAMLVTSDELREILSTLIAALDDLPDSGETPAALVHWHLCADHQPDRWEPDGTCPICEGHRLAALVEVVREWQAALLNARAAVDPNRFARLGDAHDNLAAYSLPAPVAGEGETP